MTKLDIDEEKYSEVLKRLDHLSASAHDIISEIYNLINSILEINNDSNGYNFDIHTYEDTINALERLLETNCENSRIVNEIEKLFESLKQAASCPSNAILTTETKSEFLEVDKLQHQNPHIEHKPANKEIETIPILDREHIFDDIMQSSCYLAPQEETDLQLQKVEFSAIAPKTFVKGEYSIINIIVYEHTCRYIVDELIKTMEEPVQETRSGTHMVSEGTQIKIVLSSPDIEIEDNIETGVWQGEYLDLSFAVLLPEDYIKRKILFVATVYINDMVATKLKFIVKCSSLWKQKIAITREDVLSAFVSYASQDRNRVAAIIQGMKKARPDMDIFFDVDCLRSGEDWEQALHQEIDKRDILFLCWSHFAKESRWVNAEWKYALKQKGIDFIEPVPIESPEKCPPPEELNQKHFNDKLLFIINAE